ncbi:MAG: hypothetical protein AAF211_27180, partial [Myxococcota bacterium]
MIGLLVGCGWFAPAVEELVLPGLEVDLPGGFVALDDDALAERLAAARAEAPTQTHALAAARRGPRGAGGLVQIQRSEDPDAAGYGPTVRAVLDALEADLRAQASDGSFSAQDREGGRELCSERPVEDAVQRTCALLTVSPERALMVRAVTCTAPAEVCASPLASRRYATVPALPLDAPLVAPGALPRGGRGVWGFTLGSSRRAFRDACRAAGHPVDAYDWSEEPAVVREWFDAGRTSRCDGLPVAPGLGPARAASAV